MKSTQLVSILINNYNYGRFLADAIDSALEQRYAEVEVVVVDDGSTDNSREVMASYGVRVSTVAKVNGGQASAFNAGFAASKGEIVCFLDSDDIFLPDKVRRIVEIFNDDPDIGWCFDTPKWFGSLPDASPLPSAKLEAGRWDVRETLANGTSPYIPTATSGLSFRRRTLSRILPMPEVIRITSDNYIKFAALGLSAGWMESDTLSLQRIHGENAYTNRAVGKRRLVGRTAVLTGICLRQNFPGLERLALGSFCGGLAILWLTGGVDSDMSKIVSSHFRSMSPAARMGVWTKVIYLTSLAIMRKLVRAMLGWVGKPKVLPRTAT